MGYIEAIEMAGAEILGSKFAGSYQGTWGAMVIYEGKKGLVIGAYGSCSGCDAFEREFDWEPEATFNESENKYYNSSWNFSPENEITKEEYDLVYENYKKRLIKFGENYLTNPWEKLDIENRLKNTNPDEWYDQEERELLEWAIKFFD